VIWTHFGHYGHHPTNGTYLRVAQHAKLLAPLFWFNRHQEQRWRLLNWL